MRISDNPGEGNLWDRHDRPPRQANEDLDVREPERSPQEAVAAEAEEPDVDENKGQ